MNMLPPCACPWCSLQMPPDDKDPLTERRCEMCATYTLTELKAKHPEMGKLYDIAVLYDAVVFCNWPAYVVDRGVPRAP